MIVNRPGIFQLLRGYKEGYVYLANKSDALVTASEQMAQAGLLTIKELDLKEHKTARIYHLTEIGVNEVKTNLLKWLTEAFLYQVKPALLIHDHLDLLNTVQNDKHTLYVMPPHDQAIGGRYVLTQIGVDNLVIDGVGPLASQSRRVRLYECRQYLKLAIDKLGTLDVELRRRLGLIHPKAVTQRLLKIGVDNLQAVNLLNDLRGQVVSEGRWNTGLQQTDNTLILRETKNASY